MKYDCQYFSNSDRRWSYLGVVGCSLTLRSACYLYTEMKIRFPVSAWRVISESGTIVFESKNK